MLITLLQTLLAESVMSDTNDPAGYRYDNPPFNEVDADTSERFI